MKYLKQPPQKLLFDGNKLLWYPDRLEKFMKGEKITPISVDIGIHKGCNISCVFCYGYYQKKSMDYIPTSALLRFTKDCKRCEIKGVAIVGDGEPTLNAGLYEFVEALTENKIASAVATNGLLLDDKKINRLTANCSWLRFNVSAVGDRYPDIHRGTKIADFHRLEGIIRYAVENKGDCTIGIQMVLIPDCFDQIIPFAEWALAIGVDYAQIKQFSFPGSKIPVKVNMGRYNEAIELLKKAEKMSTETTKIKIKWKAIEDSQNIALANKWDFDRCIDLPFLFQVSGNGKCYPCGYLFNNEKYCYGDLITDSLYDIIQSDRYWNIIDEISKIPMKKLCLGQCRHCSSLQFMDRFTKAYKENTIEALISLCGSKEQYELLRDNPPKHLEFC